MFIITFVGSPKIVYQVLRKHTSNSAITAPCLLSTPRMEVTRQETRERLLCSVTGGFQLADWTASQIPEGNARIPKTALVILKR